MLHQNAPKPDGFSATVTGAMGARLWLLNWCQSDDHKSDTLEAIYGQLKQRHLEAIMSAYDFNKRYDMQVPRTAITRAMEISSDIRLMALAGDAWGKLDIQPHYTRESGGIFGGAIDVVYVQVWLGEDPEDAMPVMAVRSDMSTGACKVMIDAHREVMGFDFHAKLWKDGYIMNSEPAVVVCDFAVDVQDFARRRAQPPAGAAAAAASSSTDFGQGVYRSK